MVVPSERRPEYGPWRWPGVESDDLYPGLSLNEERVSGSIVIDHGRLNLSAIVGFAIRDGWSAVESYWAPRHYPTFTGSDFADFLHDLLECSGEFGRLLLVLADAERHDRDREEGPWWWQRKEPRTRVADQLRLCLAALDRMQENYES